MANLALLVLGPRRFHCPVGDRFATFGEARLSAGEAITLHTSAFVATGSDLFSLHPAGLSWTRAGVVGSTGIGVWTAGAQHSGAWQ